MKKQAFDNRVNKKTGEELQAYLQFRRRGSKVPAKKGKGSYNRAEFKKGA
jgi:stalled ribosome alternative rescue factor ArfA